MHKFTIASVTIVAIVLLLACQSAEGSRRKKPVKVKVARTPDTEYKDAEEEHEPEPKRDKSLAKVTRSRRFHNPQGNLVKNKYLRISGGNYSDTKNFPYLAAIYIHDRFWCTGSVVDVNWILTAAHCLNYVLHVSQMNTLETMVKVRVGSHLLTTGGQLVNVIGAIRHPKFEEEPAPHADVALLKLKTNLEFNQYVNLIKIYEGMKEPFAQSFITLSGWGSNNASENSFNEVSEKMTTARLKVRTHSYCADSYQRVNGFEFSEDLFCASLRNGSRDACLFDAGSAAVQNNRLVGVMSFGPERCKSVQPAVFVKAFYFREFVKATIASFKTPADLIEAMGELQEGLPEVKTEEPGAAQEVTLETTLAEEETTTVAPEA